MQHLRLVLVLPVLFFGSGGECAERRCVSVASDTTLECPKKEETLAIQSAIYRSSNQSEGGFCREDVRLFVNTRCSGLERCRFRLSDDHGMKVCTHQDEAAMLDVAFTCVPASSVARYCNGRLEGWNLREGYIASPGYPRFYPSLPNCTWLLTARPGQSFKLTVLDLHLVGNSKCTRESDTLTIMQPVGQLLLEGCGLMDGDWTGVGNHVLESVGPKVTVTFITHRIAPRRGFLLHYQVQGCPTLAAPTGGYLVSRNATAAFYLCCRGHAFNDTGQNALLLRCTDGHWDSSYLPTCLPTNSTEVSENLASRDGVMIRIPERDLMADVVVPTILMSSLLLGNAVVMAVILKIRKRRKDPS